MTRTDAGRPADLDFEEYVGAREHTLVRAAFLVCGDERRAVELLGAALLGLATHWEQVRHEQPDVFVRRTLYRDAIRAGRARRPDVAVPEPVEDEPDDAWDAEEVRHRLEVALSEPVWEEPDDGWDAEEVRRRRRMLRALDTLTARQRAVLVLLSFEDRDEGEAAEVLGSSVGSVRAEARDAVAGLRAALPSGWLDATSTVAPDLAGLTDLADLLELASDDLPAVDLAQASWEQARRRHRAVVRRTVLGVGAVAAAGAALTVVLREPPPSTPRPSVDSTPTVAADGRLASTDVDGVPVFLAPDPRAEAKLPRYPGADDLAIPRHLGPGDPSTWAVFGEDGLRGVPETVRAVFLVANDEGELNPVLLVPGASTTHVLVPGVVLDYGDEQPFDSRAIADDRHRVVFFQRSRVVVLDARDGSVVQVDVPDFELRAAGWARDGATVIARGRWDAWVVDPGRGTARRTQDPVHPDGADLSAGDEAAVLRSFSETGELTGSRELRGPLVVPNGVSVSYPRGWVAASAYLPGDYQRATQRTQGLVAVHGEPRPTPRVLAATKSALVPDRCYRPLAVGPEGVVLLESRSERPGFQGTVRRVLAWDPLGGRLWRVADIDRAADGLGEFSGAYAL